MPFVASLSTTPDTAGALVEVCTGALEKLGKAPDLAIVFFSPHHTAAQAIATTLTERLQPRCLIGCIGESIVGNDWEIEHRPALALWLAAWSKPVELEAFHLELEHTPDGASLLGWPDSLVGADVTKAAMVLLGDPFTFPIDALLQQVNTDHRGLRVVGGMASGIRGPGQCRLLLGDRVFDAGAVGVALHDTPPVRSVVSQGCRPIGKHMVITSGEDNIITQLGGKPPLEQLQQLWHELPPRDQQLFQQGLHVGLVINEYQGEFQRGDFLVRNVLGVDRSTGALAVTDRIRVGQTVQFHVRDAETADEDLKALLKQDVQMHPQRSAAALLFTCNGRGTRLFPEPNHDAAALRRELGDLPTAGFFAQGELGPVGGQNFIHGFTASAVLFEE